MLHLVVIMFCLDATPKANCDNVTARQMERLWIYQANVEDCVRFATDYVMRGDFDLDERYVKVFCPRTETFEHSYSEVIGR